MPILEYILFRNWGKLWHLLFKVLIILIDDLYYPQNNLLIIRANMPCSIFLMNNLFEIMILNISVISSVWWEYSRSLYWLVLLPAIIPFFQSFFLVFRAIWFFSLGLILLKVILPILDPYYQEDWSNLI